MLEFATACLPFFALFFATVDFNYAVFARSILRHAARQGARFAITAQVYDGMGHDDSIRKAIKDNSLGLLQSPDSSNKIKIKYYLADGATETGHQRSRQLRRGLN